MFLLSINLWEMLPQEEKRYVFLTMSFFLLELINYYIKRLLCDDA